MMLYINKCNFDICIHSYVSSINCANTKFNTTEYCFSTVNHYSDNNVSELSIFCPVNKGFVTECFFL